MLRLQTDERLAELAIAGHEAAFDAIVVRYRAPIQRYCAGIVGASRAEDATQQALMNAHDALKRTDEVRHLRSWLYRIAHNVSLNLLRAVRDDAPLEDVERAGAGAPLAASPIEPSESFERSERFRATVAALQELPERQRAALVLRELEGRSHEEIADALGVTKGSARQHLMRARVAVRSAVTAITPYPLIARLAEWAGGSGGAAANAGWAEALAGTGATATLAKLTAGVAATGALVGGAVGTQQIVKHGDESATGKARAAEVANEKAAAGVRPATVVQAAGPATEPASSATRVSARDDRGGSSGGGPGSSSGGGPTGGRDDDHDGRGSEPAETTTQPASNGGGGHAKGDSSGERRGREKSAKNRSSHKAKPKAKAKPKGKGKGKTKAKAKTKVKSNTGSGHTTPKAKPIPPARDKPDGGSEAETVVEAPPTTTATTPAQVAPATPETTAETIGDAVAPPTDDTPKSSDGDG